MLKVSAKFKRGEKGQGNKSLPLDTDSEKTGRGRRPRIPASWIRGRADNYRWIFDLLWDELWPRLSKAQTAQDVVLSFSGTKAGSYALEFIPLAELILNVLRDRKFPRRKPEAQINFLADSIAGYGTFTPRSSRDICEKERARINKLHRILSYEYYIECSCGYKGHSRKHACPKCEAEIQFFPISPFYNGGIS
jgi:hypothetical protein